MDLPHLKKVETIVSPRSPHFVGDGFRVHNFIPGTEPLSMVRMDPFVMLDYNSKYYFPATNKPRGVGVHPHKGFETVTIVYKGAVAHHDSAGNSGIIKEGDVQWMTAGAGILHKEYHEEEFSKQGGDFHLVQLWVNLPSRFKSEKPKYQELKSSLINKYFLPENQGCIEIIAGNYMNIKGVASTYTPMHLFNLKLKNGGKAPFCFPEGFNTLLLVVKGEITINNKQHVKTDHLALFSNEGENFILESIQDATVLLLSAEPINEPIAAHGPFVMNTREELIEAINDFNEGKFGELTD